MKTTFRLPCQRALKHASGRFEGRRAAAAAAASSRTVISAPLNGKNAFERHNAAFYLWEAALKLLSCVAIVQYAAQASQDTAVSEKLQNLARPSTGHWWDFLRTLTPLLAATDSEFEAVRDLLLGPARARSCPARPAWTLRYAVFSTGKGTPCATVKPQELFDRLVRYRNRVFGHGAAGLHDQAFYDEMSRSLLAGLGEIFGRLDVLAGCKLIYISDVRRQASGDWLVERFDLTGETPRRLESLEMPEQTASQLPRPQEVCLELKDRRRIALRPLLFFDFDASSFYFLNSRRQKRNAEYLCYSTGKEIERDELRNERRKFLTDILGVSVDEATMSAWAAQSREDSTEPAAEQADAGESIGEFQLLSEIDRGGMGVVYRAWQPSLERQVALKCTRWYGDAKTEGRFHREIRALGRVEHPNVVKVFASGSYGDRWFYAMELVEGADLAKVSQRLAESPASEIGLSEWQAAISTACEAAKQHEKPISTSDAFHAPRVAPPAPVVEQSPDWRKPADTSLRLSR